MLRARTALRTHAGRSRIGSISLLLITKTAAGARRRHTINETQQQALGERWTPRCIEETVNRKGLTAMTTRLSRARGRASCCRCVCNGAALVRVMRRTRAANIRAVHHVRHCRLPTAAATSSASVVSSAPPLSGRVMTFNENPVELTDGHHGSNRLRYWTCPPTAWSTSRAAAVIAISYTRCALCRCPYCTTRSDAPLSSESDNTLYNIKSTAYCRQLTKQSSHFHC